MPANTVRQLRSASGRCPFSLALLAVLVFVLSSCRPPAASPTRQAVSAGDTYSRKFAGDRWD